MKNIFKILSISLVALSVASCDESAWDDGVTQGEGSVELGSLNIEVNNAEKVISRASTDVNDFLVSVIDNSTETKMWAGNYGEMPEILTLPAGDNYEVIVESHAINDAEWDRPYYKGNKSFKIEKAKITKVGEVIAKFSSLKVTIKFHDELKKVLGGDAKVTVKGSNGSELVYTPSETRAGYFAIDGSTTFAAHFYATVDGVLTTNETAFKGVDKGQHHILTYSVKGTPDIPEQSGTLDSPDVVLDVDYEVKDVNSNTQVEEDLLDSSDRPGKEEWEDPDDPGNDNPGIDDPEEKKPVYFEPYNSPNLSLYSVNEISEATAEEFGNAVVRIHSEAGIKLFYVEISSTDDTLFMPAIDDLGLSNFELTNPDATAQSNLKKLELPYGDQVLNQNLVDFDITAFVPFLVPFEGEHTFKMEVIDNNNFPNTIELRFKVKNN